MSSRCWAGWLGWAGLGWDRENVLRLVITAASRSQQRTGSDRNINCKYDYRLQYYYGGTSHQHTFKESLQKPPKHIFYRASRL